MTFPANRITWSNYLWACTYTPPGKWFRAIYVACRDLRRNIPMEA